MTFRMTFTILFAGLLLFIGGAATTQEVSAAPNADCLNAGNGSMADLSSWSFTFTCSAPATVYFGVCDSGSLRLDDFVNITYNGAIVASNSGTDGDEDITFGSADVTAGTHTATLNSVSDGSGPVTFGYSVSADLNEAFLNAQLRCGSDYNVSSPTVPNVPTTTPTTPTTTPATTSFQCVAGVPVFTQDTAPSAGKLVLMAAYGLGSKQPEGRTVASWNVAEGQRLNNALVAVEAPNHIRLWWQPADSDTWYLMTSQYWNGTGAMSGEFGVACVSAMPSYHTSFADAIAANDLP